MDEDERFAKLLGRSSLGSQAARELRERTAVATAEAVRKLADLRIEIATVGPDAAAQAADGLAFALASIGSNVGYGESNGDWVQQIAEIEALDPGMRLAVRPHPLVRASTQVKVLRQLVRFEHEPDPARAHARVSEIDRALEIARDLDPNIALALDHGLNPDIGRALDITRVLDLARARALDRGLNPGLHPGLVRIRDFRHSHNAALTRRLDLARARALARTLDLAHARGVAAEGASDFTGTSNGVRALALLLDRERHLALALALPLALDLDFALVRAGAGVVEGVPHHIVGRAGDLARELARALNVDSDAFLARDRASALDIDLVLSRVDELGHLLDEAIGRVLRVETTDGLGTALLEGALDNFTGADLSAVDLGHVDLVGVCWSLSGTRWPPGTDMDELQNRSRETKPGSGVFIVEHEASAVDRAHA